MRSRSIFLAVCLGVAAMSPAFAERWLCEYDGQWSTFNSNEKGKFNWSVEWQGTRNGWEVTGDYEDRFGKSTLDGKCDDSSCRFGQTYRSGELKGKRYFWKGDYTDDLKGNTSTNRIQGTWGTNSAANDGGNWRAVALCKQR